MAGEAGFGPCDLMPAVFDPLKKQGQGKIRRGGKQTPAQHSDNSWEEEKKKNLIYIVLIHREDYTVTVPWHSSLSERGHANSLPARHAF